MRPYRMFLLATAADIVKPYGIRMDWGGWL